MCLCMFASLTTTPSTHNFFWVWPVPLEVSRMCWPRIMPKKLKCATSKISQPYYCCRESTYKFRNANVSPLATGCACDLLVLMAMFTPCTPSSDWSAAMCMCVRTFGARVWAQLRGPRCSSRDDTHRGKERARSRSFSAYERACSFQFHAGEFGKYSRSIFEYAEICAASR